MNLFQKLWPTVIVPYGLWAVFVHKVGVLFHSSQLEAVGLKQICRQTCRIVEGLFKIAVRIDTEFYPNSSEITAVTCTPVPRMPSDFIVGNVMIDFVVVHRIMPRGIAALSTQ